jgi:hypothetical protein
MMVAYKSSSGPEREEMSMFLEIKDRNNGSYVINTEHISSFRECDEYGREGGHFTVFASPA